MANLGLALGLGQGLQSAGEQFTRAYGIASQARRQDLLAALQAQREQLAIKDLQEKQAAIAATPQNLTTIAQAMEGQVIPEQTFTGVERPGEPGGLAETAQFTAPSRTVPAPKTTAELLGRPGVPEAMTGLVRGLGGEGLKMAMPETPEQATKRLEAERITKQAQADMLTAVDEITSKDPETILAGLVRMNRAMVMSGKAPDSNLVKYLSDVEDRKAAVETGKAVGAGLEKLKSPTATAGDAVDILKSMAGSKWAGTAHFVPFVTDLLKNRFGPEIDALQAYARIRQSNPKLTAEEAWTQTMAVAPQGVAVAERNGKGKGLPPDLVEEREIAQGVKKIEVETVPLVKREGEVAKAREVGREAGKPAAVRALDKEWRQLRNDNQRALAESRRALLQGKPETIDSLTNSRRRTMEFLGKVEELDDDDPHKLTYTSQAQEDLLYIGRRIDELKKKGGGGKPASGSTARSSPPAKGKQADREAVKTEAQRLLKLGHTKETALQAMRDAGWDVKP